MRADGHSLREFCRGRHGELTLCGDCPERSLAPVGGRRAGDGEGARIINLAHRLVAEVVHHARRQFAAAHLHEQLRHECALDYKPGKLLDLGYIVAVVVNTVAVESYCGIAIEEARDWVRSPAAMPPAREPP